ncbi:aryl-sulfate sulfotransferase [Winogradskyella litoriviva]|uniref:Aryl-sulfate sulfotransferase n=1 Tax=Winogradskyella litoriviva TaxID=1220182 RepID=A0ABX2E977_9FLAO|nr:aryl-sulfate sulfotransferase [Winogradskyella litoriviva]NRD24775.1 aryl-sulfate sulfotransferase [Winogradskyella litoriviva]
MHRKLLFALLISINVVFSQNTIGTTSISEGVYDGYTLFTSHTETYLINNCGEVINQWTSSFPPGNAVYLLENGDILRAGRTSSSDITFGGQGGVIEIYNWEGNLTWQYFYDTPMMRQHHDIYPMPNGNVLILAVTRMTNAEAIQAGRNPAELSETDLYNEQIIEVTPVGANSATIVWEWNVKDHLVQDFDNSKDNFGDVGLSPEKLNINFLNGGSGASNWLHFNSIQFNPVLDQIIISSRNLSEIYIIDHSTSTAEAATNSGGTYNKGGDFLYRWGNPQSYNQGTEADRQLYGQHYPYVIENGILDAGKIIVFNNGNGRNPMFSEVFIINPETDSPGVYTYQSNTAFGPVAPDYIYSNSASPTDFFSGILSSAQRLPNGNTLICEGINGRMFEITPNESIVWEYINPVNSNNGTVSSQETEPSTFANTIFRSLKYKPEYAAFIDKDLTPSDPIELNPDLSACYSLSISDFEQFDISFYPNPTKGSIAIDSNKTIDKIEAYNTLGRKIIESNTKAIDLSNQSNGIYFLRIYSGSNNVSKKVIKH